MTAAASSVRLSGVRNWRVTGSSASPAVARARARVRPRRSRAAPSRALTEAAPVWDGLGRDAGALYRGTRLIRARETFGDDEARAGDGREDELNQLERDFLTASAETYERGRRAAARAARRLRALTAALAVLLCLAVVAGVTAWQQSGVSARRRDEAEARGAAELVDTLRQTDPRTAAQLAPAAWRVADLPETGRALRTAAGAVRCLRPPGQAGPGEEAGDGER